MNFKIGIPRSIRLVLTNLQKLWSIVQYERHFTHSEKKIAVVSTIVRDVKMSRVMARLIFLKLNREYFGHGNLPTTYTSNMVSQASELQHDLLIAFYRAHYLNSLAKDSVASQNTC